MVFVFGDKKQVVDEGNLPDDTDDELDVRKMLGKQRKLKKRKSGGFQSMGLLIK